MSVNLNVPALLATAAQKYHLISALLFIFALTCQIDCVNRNVQEAQGGQGMEIYQTAAVANLPATDIQIYVDNTSPSASDANNGTDVSLPLLTVQEGVLRARANKRKNISTTVVIMPGTYRETVTLAWTNRDENQPDNKTPVVIRAAEPGTVILSGSDVWSDWTYDERSNSYSHEWPFKWGEFDPGWDLKGVGARREMVFADGVLLTQVASQRALLHGTFYVDETTAMITIMPAEGDDVSHSTIEIATRDVVWDQRYEDNVFLDGLIVEHAATQWKGGLGGARFTNSDGLSISNSVFRYNNWAGIYVGESSDINLRNVQMNRNGGQGWSTWRVSDFVAVDTETSYNNWRGALSDFTGWAVGNKLESMHGLSITNHKAVGNHSRGLWLDYDIQEATLDSLYIADNLLDGLWLEANSGPIVLRNSLLERNGKAGLRSTFTENVTLENNILRNNSMMQLEIAGENRRWVEDFVTGERMHLTVRDWTIIGNTFEGGEQLIGVASNHKFKEWTEFIGSLHSTDNVFIHENAAAFMIRQKTLSFIEARSLEDFKGWQEHTGQDSNSTFKRVERD